MEIFSSIPTGTIQLSVNDYENQIVRTYGES